MSERPARKVFPPKDMEPTYGGLHTGHMIPDLDGLPWWQRVLCALGYHYWEERHALSPNGRPRMKLRDQCGRCRIYR